MQKEIKRVLLWPEDIRAAKAAESEYDSIKFWLAKMHKGEYTVKEQSIKTFSPAAALRALSADFFDERACRGQILKSLHPEGVYCPGCGQRIEDGTNTKNFWELKRCECKRCGKWFNATTGTILYNSQLDMRQTYLLAVFLALGMKDKQIAKVLNISAVTVRLWRMRFETIEREGLF